jgi:hypothetical protein
VEPTQEQVNILATKYGGTKAHIMEWGWQDLHDDDKTCMQSSYWELILENGQ